MPEGREPKGRFDTKRGHRGDGRTTSAHFEPFRAAEPGIAGNRALFRAWLTELGIKISRLDVPIRAPWSIQPESPPMHSPQTPPVSLVNRLAVTGVVAVLVSAGVLGTVATMLARQSLQAQAQEKLAVVGDAASMRIGEWVAGNLRTGASVTAAAAPDAITKAMGEATLAGFAK